MAGIPAVAGLGRGRKLTIQGKIRDCAKGVIEAHRQGGKNQKYNMAYFGNAMRDHISFALKDGSAYWKSDLTSLIEAATVLLRGNCDGQDCSFVS